ncbi:hypothetical protein [Stutzerimonas frequens]|jgi:hypothetical protein|nr:hypothetical protein [Stutzerimonas frequens]MDL0440917.1 hypothetical protein [Stutzerimonas frequens]
MRVLLTTDAPSIELSAFQTDFVEHRLSADSGSGIDSALGS